MKTKDIKKGISLIVLIITIIVVIILAAVVILTLSKNNPIESAKEARFKEDVRTFQDELALYISKQYANSGGHWDGNISAKSYNQIVEYIPSFTKKYEGKFIINNNNLEYTNKLDEKEKEYTQSLNVKEKIKLLPDEYQQVEYIESTGTQYIDTGIACSESLTFECKWEPTQYGGVNGSYYWNGSAGQKAYCFGAYNNAKLYLGIGRTTKISTDAILNKTYITIGKSDYMKTYSDDTEDTVLTNYIDNNLKFYLFACDTEQPNISKVHYYTYEKMYHCKIGINNKLKRYFIPCYSTTTVTDVNGKECPSGTKGMYDTVEEKFYTNQGTGEFIAGPDVD